jgi:hypothetical protein
LHEFYKHSQMGDGYLNKCKSCTKHDSKKDYQRKIVDADFIISERRRGRQKYHRLYVGTGKSNPEVARRWAEKYPEKRAAAITAYVNVETPTGSENHHWSYNEKDWLDVIFLTKKDHMKGHRFIKYDRPSKMYRRYDTGELLDTKEKHEQFIKWCILNKEN